MHSGDELLTFTRSMDSKVNVTDNILRNALFRHTVLSIATKKCKFVTASASGKLYPQPRTRGCPCISLEESQITSQDQVGSTNFVTLPAPLDRRTEGHLYCSTECSAMLYAMQAVPD